jgi:hypothetical protein
MSAIQTRLEFVSAFHVWLLGVAGFSIPASELVLNLLFHQASRQQVWQNNVQNDNRCDKVESAVDGL